jgi:hypothetical protein
MSRKVRLVAVMAALMVLLAALAAAFDQVARVPVLTHPLSGYGSGEDGANGNGGSIISNGGIPSNDSEPLFELIGAPGTPYLKLMTYEISPDGTWREVVGATCDIDGNCSVAPQTQGGLLCNRSTAVRLLRDVTGPLPTFESTYMIGDPNGDMQFDTGSGVLYVKGSSRPSYVLQHQQPLAANLSTLAGLTCSGGGCLAVPPQLQERLRQLSDMATSDADTPFAKAMSLALFLSSSCTRSNASCGSMSDFLFGSRSGSDKDFATAYALLLRSQGISARPCACFRVAPDAADQTIAPSALAYCVEVYFDQLGWVTLEPNSMSLVSLVRPEGTQPSNPIFPSMPANITGIYGLVFRDGNNDGIYQVGEEKASGIALELLDDDGGVMQTAETYAGYYLFSRIGAGGYTVHLILPQDHVMTTANDVPFSYGGGFERAPDMGIWHVEPKDSRMPTVTTITSCSDEVRKGAAFVVSGSCEAIVGQGVTSPLQAGRVQVFLMLSKDSEEGKYCCGEGDIREGRFEVACIAPLDMPLGNYQMVALFPGDASYLPSDSDPGVRVCDAAKIELSASAPRVCGAAVDIKAVLTEAASGESVEGAAIVFEMDTPWGHGAITSVTNASGVAKISLGLSSAGAIRVEARFAGTGLLDAAASSMDIESLAPLVELDGGSVLRGQRGTLFGRLTAGGEPLAGVVVSMTMEQGATRAATTNSEGVFSIGVDVLAGTPLGPLGFQLFALGQGFDAEVMVASATSVAVAYANGTASVQVLDDTGAPIPNIVLRDICGASTAEVIIGASGVGRYQPSASGNHSVLYDGDDRHASSAAYLEVEQKAEAMPWWPFAAAMLAAACLAAFLLVRRRAGAAAPRREERPKGPYQIAFPQIMHPLPDVWGAGDPLRIAVQGRPGMVRLRVDGGEGEDMDLSRGTAYTSRTLSMGMHEIEVEGPDGRCSVPVKVVDYREEVVQLYSSAFDTWKASGNVEAQMTPREALDRLADGGKLPRARAEELFFTFEYAEFSMRPVRREDYERMYLAVAEASA